MTADALHLPANRSSRWSGIALGATILSLCAFGPFLWPLDPSRLDPALVLLPPDSLHPLGTDDLGRDQLARLIQAGSNTIAACVPAVVLASILGTAYGLIAGLAPAILDRILMRLLDALLALPPIVVLIAVGSLLQKHVPELGALIGATFWPPLARLVRNETRALRGRDYVAASRQMGAGPWHIARTHILPGLTRVLAVNGTLMLGDSILAFSALGFLGLGLEPPQTSWGQMLQEGLSLIDLRPWWLMLPPGLLIAASLFACSAASTLAEPGA